MPIVNKSAYRRPQIANSEQRIAPLEGMGDIEVTLGDVNVPAGFDIKVGSEEWNQLLETQKRIDAWKALDLPRKEMDDYQKTYSKALLHVSDHLDASDNSPEMIAKINYYHNVVRPILSKDRNNYQELRAKIIDALTATITANPTYIAPEELNYIMAINDEIHSMIKPLIEMAKDTINQRIKTKAGLEQQKREAKELDEAQAKKEADMGAFIILRDKHAVNDRNAGISYMMNYATANYSVPTYKMIDEESKKYFDSIPRFYYPDGSPVNTIMPDFISGASSKIPELQKKVKIYLQNIDSDFENARKNYDISRMKEIARIRIKNYNASYPRSYTNPEQMNESQLFTTYKEIVAKSRVR